MFKGFICNMFYRQRNGLKSISHNDELMEHGTICYLSETVGDFLCCSHITDTGARSGLF